MECEEVSLQMKSLHWRQKTTTSLWKLERKGNWRKKELRPQANNAQYNTQGWNVGGGRGWSEKTGRLLYTNLYMSRVKWYDNTHKLFNPIRKGLLLTAIQIRGTAETRRCVADAVRLQSDYTECSFNPSRLESAPLPRPPRSCTCPLSPSSLIQHMVYRGASTQLPVIKIIGISILH
jgi:hypothetical protein